MPAGIRCSEYASPTPPSAQPTKRYPALPACAPPRSLFNRQPFAPPTEQFTLPVFRQAFTAVQSCVVHLQGVELG